VATPAPIRPARLRRRLTIAFVLVGGLSTGALALGSYLISRHARLDDSESRALAQSRLNALVADVTLRGRPGDIARLQSRFATRASFATVIGQSGRIPAGRLPVPADLRADAARGQVAYERSTIAGVPYLIVAEPVVGRDTQLYFFYDESQVWADLDQLRDILIAGWLVLAALSGVAGALLARRTLAPVAGASAAARSLAEGLLDTRLPATGSDEFGEWASSFNHMADALQGKITALTEAQARERRFTADVAHELRTPLTALVNEAALLERHAPDLPEEAGRLTNLLVRDVSRLRRLTDDLMEVSRIDSGAEAVRIEHVDLRPLVETILRSRGWDGRVSVTGDAALATDRRRIERIVANLAGNAVEHGGGSARVRLDGGPDETVIEVADDGPGIPADFLPRLFDRFSKADAARTASGSGLGLAIARENAVLLGGSIAAESRPGGGATFTVRLPALNASPEENP
jgi:two-component system, OmpR family, sensor histidine kinase MtrB